MATSEEAWESRIGTATGAEGPSGVVKSFNVTVDNVTDDPILVCQTLSAPFGAQHNLYPYAVATDWILRERKAAKTWVVDVVYRGHWEIDYTSWKLNISGSTESETIQETVEADLAARKPIGPPVYVTRKQGDADADSYAVGKHGTQFLKRTEARSVTGFTRNRPVTSVTLSRTQVTYNVALTGIISTYQGKLNSGSFLDAMPGALTFMSFTVDEVPGVAEGQTPPDSGILFDVQANFHWSTELYSPITLSHMWKDEEGNEARIVDIATGLFVVEDFEVIERRDFTTLMGLFG